MEKHRFGLSTVSGYPYSAIDIAMVAEWAAEAGYDFLQALPQRGIWGNEDLALPIFYAEKAWNPIWLPIQGLPVIKNIPFCYGAEKMPATGFDWFGFPTPPSCRRAYLELLARTPRPRVVSHSFEDAERSGGMLVELHPELEMSPDDIDLKCGREGYGLVLDTAHLCRGWGDRKRKGPTPFWGYQSGLPGVVALLAPHIQVVHVKSVTDEMALKVVEWLLRSEHREKFDLIAEFKPCKDSLLHPRKFMRAFNNGMRRMVGES